MKKRLSILILCIVMVLTFIPGSVLAAEVVQEKVSINLGSYNKEVGECPTYIWDSVDNEKYFVFHETWYNVTDNITLSETDTFEAGKLYMYMLQFNSYSSDFVFDQESEIVIDSIEWDDSYSWVRTEEEYSNGSLAFGGYYTPGCEGVDDITLNISDSVEAGEELVYVDELSSDSKYTIAEQGWYTEDEVALPEGTTYEEDVTYDYYIKLKPAEGYRFKTETACIFDGVDWEYSECYFNFEDVGYIVFHGVYTVPVVQSTTEATTEAPTTEATTEAPTTEATTEAPTTEAATEVSTTVAPTTEVTTTSASNITSPETGDNNGTLIWISILCVAAGAFITVMAVRVRKQ